MNLEIFFDKVRHKPFNGRLTQDQVEGMQNIILYRDENYSGVTDDQLAYMLATVKWETAHTMQPVEEGYPDTGERLRAFQRGLRYYPYYGRGLVQLTWQRNYEYYGIADDPEKALDWRWSLWILFDGMVRGVFTGKKLSDYIGEKRDYINARRIINGTDRAQQIADIAESFRAAIVAANEPVVPDLQSRFEDMLALALTKPRIQELVRQLRRD